MKIIISSACAMLVGCILACAPTMAIAGGKHRAHNPPPITLSETGAFEVGGTVLGDPETSSLSCDHGYVEYFIPQKARATSLIMWHSSSTKVWENRWDGGEGYKSIMLRRGYPVHLWDGPRVGRANWGCEAYTYTPGNRDQGNFVAWRFGPSFMNWHPGVQFPTESAEAWEQATRARYVEFDTLDNALVQAKAGGKAIDKIGPVVALTNSAGGWRALLSALEATTDNMKGLVAYETPGFVYPEEAGYGTNENAAFGPYSVPLAEFMKLTKFPIQMVFGDNTAGTFWATVLNNARDFCDIVNDHGGDCEVLVLTDAGLSGNTHIAFADLNNVKVADQLSKWLHRKGLDKFPHKKHHGWWWRGRHSHH